MTIAGDRRAAALEQCRFLWPATPDGAGVPCTAEDLEFADTLDDQGGGTKVLRMVRVSVPAGYFPKANRPSIHQACRFRPSPAEDWQLLHVAGVNVPSGGRTIDFTLRHQT